jgi:hypothetical protein
MNATTRGYPRWSNIGQQWLQTRDLLTALIYVVAVLLAGAAGWYLGHGAAGRALLIAAGVPLVLLSLNARLSSLTAVLVFLMPFPLVSNALGGRSLHLLLIPAFLLMALAHRSSASLKLPKDAPRLPLLAFALATLISTIVSDQPGEQVLACALLGLGLAFMLVVATVGVDEPARRRAIAAMGICGLCMSVVGILQIYWPTLPVPGLLGNPTATENLGRLGTASRLAGPMGDYELFAEFLAMTCFVQLWASLNAKRVLNRALWSAAAGISLVTIFSTGTRSAIVQLTLEVLLYGVIRREHLTAGLKLAVTGGLALLIALPMLQPVSSGARLGDRFSMLGTQGPGIEGYINRYAIWQRFAAAADLRFPELFGRGPRYDYEGIGLFPHSLFLYLLTTVGLVATIAFALFLLALVVRLLLTWRRQRSETALVLAVILAGFTTNEIKIEFFRLVHYQAFVWALLGLSVAALDLRRDRPADGQP